jgi:hypothetical protein
MQTAQFTAAVAIAGLSLSPAYAAGQGKSGASPKAHGPSTHAQAPRTTATHGAPKPPTTTHGNPHTTTTKTSSPTTTTKAHGNPHTATSTSATGATTPVSTAGAATNTSTTTLNPIAAKLKGKPLGSRIEQMLAPTGMTLNTASDGFRNQGQFIAAVHVSQNLGVPFADLKATMLGTPLPGAASAITSPMSLGQAIQQLKPFSNATTEAARAETQAATDLQTISASTTNTTTTKKSRTRGR